MADCVRAHGGMSRPSPRDINHASARARAMLATLDKGNDARTTRGEVALRAGIGLQFGRVVPGDSVNEASRLEAATRSFGTSLAASQVLIDRALERPGEHALGGMHRRAPVAVRGRVEVVELWTLPCVAAMSS